MPRATAVTGTMRSKRMRHLLPEKAFYHLGRREAASDLNGHSSATSVTSKATRPTLREVLHCKQTMLPAEARDKEVMTPVDIPRDWLFVAKSTRCTHAVRTQAGISAPPTFSGTIGRLRCFSFATVTRTLWFFDVDLAPYESVLFALPDTLYVGLVDAGEDANHLVAAVAPYPPENIS